MWKYECVTRQEFESVKDKIEEFIVSLGGNEVSVDLPYTQRTVSYSGTDIVENIPPVRLKMPYRYPIFTLWPAPHSIVRLA